MRDCALLCAASTNMDYKRQSDIEAYQDQIYYSNRYSGTSLKRKQTRKMRRVLDDHFEYRHVQLPKQIAKYLPNPMVLMSEEEWRALGVRQSPGWVHYMIHGMCVGLDLLKGLRVWGSSGAAYSVI